MDVQRALVERRSVRGFRSEPVEPAVLQRVFAAAQHAPSWCNIQPWHVWVTSGESTARLTAALTAAARSALPNPEFPWPAEYPEPYGALRKQCGLDLYGAMGIPKDDKSGRYDAWMRNYVAFDAPHVAIVGIDKRFGLYAGVDVGCWLQSVLLAATSEGLSTCPQASLATYPDAVRNALEVPETIGILFGIAIGYEDPGVPANRCRTAREALSERVRFV